MKTFFLATSSSSRGDDDLSQVTVLSQTNELYIPHGIFRMMVLNLRKMTFNEMVVKRSHRSSPVVSEQEFYSQKSHESVKDIAQSVVVCFCAWSQARTFHPQLVAAITPETLESHTKLSNSRRRIVIVIRHIENECLAKVAQFKFPTGVTFIISPGLTEMHLLSLLCIYLSAAVQALPENALQKLLWPNIKSH